MIVVIGFELAKSSVEKIFDPEATTFSAAVLIVLVGSMLVKLWLAVFNGKLGNMIQSSTLAATAADSRNDFITTGVVLIAMVIEALTKLPVDGYMGLAVALFILYSGANLAKDTISPLLGEAAGPELRQMIVDEIEKEPMVLGFHDLMVHDYGPGQRFASIHVEMDQKVDPLYCHEIIDNLERECLKSHNIHLVIHYDPVVTDDPEMNRLHGIVDEILQGVDPRLKTHDFRMVCSTGHQNLVFDIALPADLSKREREIKETIDKTLAARETTKFYTVITFDPAAFNQDT